MFTRPLAVLILFFGSALVGCGRQTPEPIAQTRAPDLARGGRLFASICAQCHGAAGEGVKDRGLPLPTSVFVNSNTNRSIVEMIKVGRPPTADRPAMPPKGGRLDLTDDELHDIVAFLRTIPVGDD